MCLSPILVPRYDDGVKQGYHYVPCGHCYECRSNYRNQWTIRNYFEYLDSDFSIFLTLTYDNEHIPTYSCTLDNIIDDSFAGQYLGSTLLGFRKSDLQNYLKRVRSAIDPVKIRYFIVSEYGDNTKRPHYHLLLYLSGVTTNAKLDFVRQVLSDEWKFGFKKFGSVTPASINYCTHYMLKEDDVPIIIEEQKPFMLCSKVPALGSSLLQKYYDDNDKPYILKDGCRIPFPRYFRDRFGIGDSNYSINEFGLSDAELNSLIKQFGSYKAYAAHHNNEVKFKNSIKFLKHKL